MTQNESIVYKSVFYRAVESITLSSQFANHAYNNKSTAPPQS